MISYDKSTIYEAAGGGLVLEDFGSIHVRGQITASPIISEVVIYDGIGIC